MSTETRGEQRQVILAILVSLIACTAISSESLIFGVSTVADNLTVALSFWAIFAFSLHLTGLRLERPAKLRRWQALLVLCVAALTAWVLVLPYAKPLVRSVAAFVPGFFTLRIAFRTVARTAASLESRAGKVGCEGGKNPNE